jgi:hypothetical protein
MAADLPSNAWQYLTRQEPLMFRSYDGFDLQPAPRPNMATRQPGSPRNIGASPGI